MPTGYCRKVWYLQSMLAAWFREVVYLQSAPAAWPSKCCAVPAKDVDSRVRASVLPAMHVGANVCTLKRPREKEGRNSLRRDGLHSQPASMANEYGQPYLKAGWVKSCSCSWSLQIFFIHLCTDLRNSLTSRRVAWE